MLPLEIEFDHCKVVISSLSIVLRSNIATRPVIDSPSHVCVSMFPFLMYIRIVYFKQVKNAFKKYIFKYLLRDFYKLVG